MLDLPIDLSREKAKLLKYLIADRVSPIGPIEQRRTEQNSEDPTSTCTTLAAREEARREPRREARKSAGEATREGPREGTRELALVSRSGRRLSAGALARELDQVALEADVSRVCKHAQEHQQTSSMVPDDAREPMNHAYLLDAESGYVRECELPIAIDTALSRFAEQAGLTIEGYELTVRVKRISE
ncbi:MAG: hypothetical protein AAF194_10035 [Pseudomonadota bacterium]